MQRFALVLLVIAAALNAPALADPWPAQHEAIDFQAHPFPLADVRLLDGPFRDAQQRTRQYLHDLESDRLLYYFRETAGLPTPGEPMGGWEKTEVRGHTMGHFLSACAQMYAATADATLKPKAEAIVAELARCQAAHGDGYLSAFPQSFIDRVVPGDPASEKQHALEGESMAAGPHLNRTWRHAADGWFSYRLKVLPDRPVVLSATYWGSDSGRRTFDILVDGQKIATQTLRT